jgi:hypothetical protein
MANIIDLRNPQPEKEKREIPKTRSPVLDLPKEPKKEIRKIETTSTKTIIARQGPTPPSESTSKTIYWETPSYIQGKNKFVLYVLFIFIVAGAFAVYCFRKETTFAILLGLFAFVLLLNSGRKSRWMRILINHHGITIDNDLYLFKNILSFWIDYDDIDKDLILTMKKWYFPHLKIPINKANPLDIRSIMIDNIPERKIEKSFLDILIRTIGF